MASAEPIHVTVAYSPAPREVDQVALTLPAGSTVQDAIAASGLAQRHALDMATLTVGIWTRTQPLDTVLRERDRVELWRPLTVDPKQARRLRYKRQQIKPGQRPPRPG